MPAAAFVFFISKNVLKYGFVALVIATIGTIVAVSSYESFVMRPYGPLIAGLGTVCDLSRTVIPVTVPAYSATFWAGTSPENRRADLRKFVARFLTDYPELTTLTVGCIELPWRNRAELDAATKGKPTATSEAKRNLPMWRETFNRDDLAAGTTK